MSNMEDIKSIKQKLRAKSLELEIQLPPGWNASVAYDMNHNSPFQVNQDQTFVIANGIERAKQGHLKSEPRGNGSILGQLGSESQSSDNDQKAKKKTVLWSVFQRKPKQPGAATPEHTSPFQMDPAVNRPQVLAPSAVESVRMRGLKERTDCAFAWTRPTYPPSVGAHSSSAASSTSSTITDLLSKSTLAQSSIAREASTSQMNQSKDGQIGQPGRISTKRSGSVGNAGIVGQSTKNAIDQVRKARFSLSDLFAPNSSSGTATGITGGTPMGELLKSGRGEGRDESDEAKSRAVVGPTEFLELYRSRTYTDPRRLAEASRAAARSKHRRHNSESHTTFSIFKDELEELDDGAVGENRQNPQSLSIRRASHNILLELPIPEHTEMHFSGSSISLPSPPLCVANSTENHCPTASSSSSLSSSSSCSVAAGNNANDRRSRRVRLTDRRSSEPPMVTLQNMSTLSTCYMRMTLAQQRGEPDSKNNIHSSSSSNSINSISTSPKRPTDFSISPESLGIDSPFVSRQHLIVWRDQQSTQILKLPTSVEYHDALQEVIDEDDSLIYSELMRLHRCWELMPNSSTVVVLDIELKVVCAFHALTVHGISAAVLWDSDARKFVGMLTVTDFIRILQKYRNSKEDLERIKDDKISHWKDQLIVEGGDDSSVGGDLTSVSPDDSLYDVVCSLHSSGFHRLPVIDDPSNSALYTLGYKRILQFICLFINHLPRPDFMNRTIWELQVGTFDDVASIRQERPLHEALDLLVGRRVSALPVVDSEEKVVNIYCKADAMGLAANESYKNLNLTIGEILTSERESFEGVYLCRKSDSLSQVVEWFARTSVHRLIVVDDERKLQGIVSLSDVVRFLVLHPPKKDVQTEGCETIVPEYRRMATEDITSDTKDYQTPGLLMASQSRC